MKTMVEISHEFLMPVLHGQAICVDGTLGRGKDAQFLIDQGVSKVIGFEVQMDVIHNAMAGLDTKRVICLLDGHEHIDRYIKKPIDAAIYNFGFCPSGDQTKTTIASTSLKAVQKTFDLLRKKGRMALVLYDHKEADKEKKALLEWASSLDTKLASVQCVQSINHKNSPFLILIEKRV